MNAKVKLAMEIAEKISDKKVKIEQLVKELKELESQAALIITAKSSVPSTRLPHVSKGGRYSVKRKYNVPKVKGGYWRPRVLEALSDGKEKALHEIHQAIISKHPECPKSDPKKGYANGVSAELTYLIKDKLVDRVGKGVYKIAKSKASKCQVSTPKKTNAAGKKKLRPKGYWVNRVMAAMEFGVQIHANDICKALRVKESKEKYIIHATMAYLAKKGKVVKVSKGVWKKIYPKEEVAPSVAAAVARSLSASNKEKKAIKNLAVKTLTPQQEKFLALTKPDSLASKVLQTMKHGKEYSVENLIEKIDKNKPKLAYNTVMNVLTSLDFTKQVKASVYVRI